MKEAGELGLHIAVGGDLGLPGVEEGGDLGLHHALVEEAGDLGLHVAVGGDLGLHVAVGDFGGGRGVI